MAAKGSIRKFRFFWYLRVPHLCEVLLMFDLTGNVSLLSLVTCSSLMPPCRTSLAIQINPHAPETPFFIS